MIKNGFFLLDKEKGDSSFFALKKTQKNFKEKIKLGHSGTLDPLATGLLLVGVNKGTKVLSELILEKKSYTADIFLGKNSETDDAEGEKFEIENKRGDIPTKEEIEKIITANFLGKIIQTPPVYSALKINGKRACDRVRNGEEVIIKPREIEIYQIKVLYYNFPSLKILVECSSGTYIRSLARDIGKKLSLGAYLSDLRRETIGNFSVQDAKKISGITLDDIQEFTEKHFKGTKIFLDELEIKKIFFGQKISYRNTEKIFGDEQRVFLFSQQNKKFLGFGEIKENILSPRKLLG